MIYDAAWEAFWERAELRDIAAQVRIGDFTLVGNAGQRIPLSQIGTVEIRMEDPILRRRDRTPTITVRGDVAEGMQPPDVSSAVWQALQPVVAKLPAGYRIEELTKPP